MDWFERIWEEREEQVYPELFGPAKGGIYTLAPSVFLETFQQESFDPRWLHYGVFEVPPTPSRGSWLYVTSGLSNAWEDDEPVPSGPSGLGREFVFETTASAKWAILRVQHVMTFQILLSCGRFPGRDTLDLYDRIPLRASITPGPSDLRWIMLAPPEGYPVSFNLESGRVDLVALVGITDAEAQYARDRGGDNLLKLLKERGAFPVTAPGRDSIVRPAPSAHFT
jgi:hypothetical protein